MNNKCQNESHDLQMDFLFQQDPNGFVRLGTVLVELNFKKTVLCYHCATILQETESMFILERN